MWPQALCEAQITHTGLRSNYQYIATNGATGIRIWGKAQEKYYWFLYWGLLLFFTLLSSVSLPRLPPSFFLPKASFLSYLLQHLSPVPTGLSCSLHPSSLFTPPFTGGGRKELQFGQTSKVLFSVLQVSPLSTSRPSPEHDGPLAI